MSFKSLQLTSVSIVCLVLWTDVGGLLSYQMCHFFILSSAVTLIHNLET